MLGNFFRREGGVGHNNYEVAWPGEQGRGAVDLNLPRFAVNRVGGEAGAVG